MSEERDLTDNGVAQAQEQDDDDEGDDDDDDDDEGEGFMEHEDAVDDLDADRPFKRQRGQPIG